MIFNPNASAEQVPQTNEANVPIYNPANPPAQAQPTINVTVPQVIEKIIYKKVRMHGFFRTLTIIALLVIGFLMLLENYGIMKLSVGNLNLDVIYPIFIIFSGIVIRSYRWLFGKIFGLIMFLAVVGGFFTISIYTSLNPSAQSKLGDYINFSSPAKNKTWIALSRLDINTLIGNLVIKGKKTDNLTEWSYKSDRPLLVTSWVKNNFDYLNLKEDNNRNVLQNFYTNLSLGIDNQKTINLYLKNLMWIHNIDLSDIKRFDVQINWWLQNLTINLGENVFSGSQISIQLVGCIITISAPKNLWIKLSFKQLAWSLELTDFDIKSKNYFESRNINVAKKVVTLNIDTWISKFKILWK